MYPTDGSLPCRQASVLPVAPALSSLSRHRALHVEMAAHGQGDRPTASLMRTRQTIRSSRGGGGQALNGTKPAGAQWCDGPPRGGSPESSLAVAWARPYPLSSHTKTIHSARRPVKPQKLDPNSHREPSLDGASEAMPMTTPRESVPSATTRVTTRGRSSRCVSVTCSLLHDAANGWAPVVRDDILEDPRSGRVSPSSVFMLALALFEVPAFKH